MKRDGLRFDFADDVQKASLAGDEMWKSAFGSYPPYSKSAAREKQGDWEGSTGVYKRPVEFPPFVQTPTLWGEAGAPIMDQMPVEMPNSVPQGNTLDSLLDKLVSARPSPGNVSYRSPGVDNRAVNMLMAEIADMPQVPAKKEFKSQATGGDLTPFIKLIDTWTGSNFTDVYKSPQQVEREKIMNDVQLNAAVNAERNRTAGERLAALGQLASVLAGQNRLSIEDASNRANVGIANNSNAIRAYDSYGDQIGRAASIAGKLYDSAENRMMREDMMRMKMMGGDDKDSKGVVQNVLKPYSNDLGMITDKTGAARAAGRLWESDPYNTFYRDVAIGLGYQDLIQKGIVPGAASPTQNQPGSSGAGQGTFEGYPIPRGR